MPSMLHELLTGMFQHKPELAAELLADALGCTIPPYATASLAPGDFTDLIPTEYRADAVVVLSGAPSAHPGVAGQDAGPESAPGAALLAVVVEIQLGRDPDKRWSWPVYLASLRARLHCSAVLLIVCPDASTATGCAAPIDLGHPGWTLTPLVLGPEHVPVVTDVDQARRSPEITVMSALAHGGDPSTPDHGAVLNAFLGALDSIHSIDQKRSMLYFEVVATTLPAAARSHLEALMATPTFEFQSEFKKRYVSEGVALGEARGVALGEADALLAVLEARGIDVAEDARQRITDCTDPEHLRAWVRRAATADSIDDLFE